MTELILVIAVVIEIIFLFVGLLPGKADWEYWTRPQIKMKNLSEVPRRFRKCDWYKKRIKDKEKP